MGLIGLIGGAISYWKAEDWKLVATTGAIIGAIMGILIAVLGITALMAFDISSLFGFTLTTPLIFVAYLIYETISALIGGGIAWLLKLVF